MTEVVYQPKEMDPGEFSQIMRDCTRRIVDLRVLKAKGKRTLKATGRSDTMAFAWQANVDYRNIAMADSTFPAPESAHHDSKAPHVSPSARKVA